ncbi:ATP-grasp domain-containing protein, partial [Streptomyces sp. SID5770]|uniref:ATP-grasp domain-containing protein n=1 Tax=Streptomyces sp. SID5770 TaxID=2690308 RepID=UPI00136BC2F2
MTFGNPSVELNAIRQSACQADISVISEPPFAHQYPASLPIKVVPDLRDITAVRDAATALNRRRPINYIITPAERALQAAGFLRTYLGIPGMSYEKANLFSNKAAMKNALSTAGLPVTDFRVVSSIERIAQAAQDIGFPVVVKPAIGQGTADTFVIENILALNVLLESRDVANISNAPCQIMVEKFVPMLAELHCDGIVWKGFPQFLSVSQYYTPALQSFHSNRTATHLWGTHTLAPSHHWVAPASKLHNKAIQVLGLENGVTHMEILQTKDGPLIGELSCRPGA